MSNKIIQEDILKYYDSKIKQYIKNTEEEQKQVYDDSLSSINTKIASKASDLSLVNNKLQLKNDRGEVIGTEITLPNTGSSSSVSPTARVSKTGNTATITITDKNGTTETQIIDGKDGVKGDTGEKGEKGEKGDTGADGTDGKDGATPTLKMGTITTLSAGESATASMSQNGIAYTINLSIPSGKDGAKGDTGAKGDKGDTGAKGDKGDTGAKGADGTTPVKGVDYFTQSDIDEFSKNFAKTSSIPTKTSQLTNDSGFLTSHQDLSNYTKKTDLATSDDLGLVKVQDKYGIHVTTAGNLKTVCADNDSIDAETDAYLPIVPKNFRYAWQHVAKDLFTQLQEGITWTSGYLKTDYTFNANSTYEYCIITLYKGDRLTGTVYNSSSSVPTLVYNRGGFKQFTAYDTTVVIAPIDKSGTITPVEVNYEAPEKVTICLTTYFNADNVPDVTLFRNLVPEEQVSYSTKSANAVYKLGYAKNGKITASSSGTYELSNAIELHDGEVLCYSGTGSTGINIADLLDEDGNFVKALRGGGKAITVEYYYHATSTCYVRLCRTVSKSDNIEPYIINRNILFQSPLYGKTMIVIGDSLINGNSSGNYITWIDRIAQKYNMTYYNYGINGNAIAHIDGASGTPMSERYTDIVTAVPKADYIVVEGGANDKNNSCPIGTNSDTENTTFKGAINVLVNGLRQAYPGSSILFMTTFFRYATTNNLGLGEEDYANAMIEVCRARAIPCFDNCHDSGITFIDKTMDWADEGKVAGSNYNSHLSAQGYAFLFPKYVKFLEAN